MITTPTPPLIARTLLTADSDAIIHEHVISYEMASETSVLRREYTFKKYSRPV
jgi:hypothetical protein